MEKETAAPKVTAKRKKTGGRQKGGKNKTTAELKNWVFVFVNENLATFKKEFNKMEPPDKITLILKLLPYILPKQMENKLTFDDDLAKAVKESMEKVNEMFK